jgi:hypothetical protein
MKKGTCADVLVDGTLHGVNDSPQLCSALIMLDIHAIVSADI